MIDNPAATLVAVIAAGATASMSLKDITVLQNLLIGVALGTLVSKLLVWRQERRRRRELPARRVRQIETVWIVIAAVAALSASAVDAVL